MFSLLCLLTIFAYTDCQSRRSSLEASAQEDGLRWARLFYTVPEVCKDILEFAIVDMIQQ